MTREEMVKEYVSRFPGPDQDMCMEIKLVWNGSAAKHGGLYSNEYDLKTGKKKIITPAISDYPQYRTKEHTIVQLRPKSPGYDDTVLCVYAKNIPEYEMCEIGRVQVKATRPDKTKNKDMRPWEFGENWYKNHFEKARFFLFKGDAIAYNENGEIFHPEERGKYYNREVLKLFNSTLCPQGCMGSLIANNQMSFFAYGHDLASTPDDEVKMTGPYWWAKWYRVVETRPASKHSKKVKDIIEGLTLRSKEELEKLSPVICHKLTRTDRTGSTYDDSHCTKNYAFLDKQGDNYVISYYTRDYNFTYSKELKIYKTMKEGEIKEIPNIPFDEHPKYIILNAKKQPTIYTYDKRDKKYHITGAASRTILDSCNPVEFYKGDKWDEVDCLIKAKQIAEEVNRRSRYSTSARLNYFPYIIDILRNPIIFKMHDLGLNNLVTEIVQDYYPRSQMNHSIGIERNSIKASLTEFFGMTEEQLKILDTMFETTADRWGCMVFRYSYCSKIMQHMKQMFPELTKLSKEDFEMFCKELAPTCGNWRWYEKYIITDSYKYYRHELTKDDYANMADMIYLKHKDPEAGKFLGAAIELINDNFNPDEKPQEHKINKLATNETEAKAFYNKVRLNLTAKKAGKPILW